MGANRREWGTALISGIYEVPNLFEHARVEWQSVVNYF
jgi:hypothetical protein